MQNRKLSALTLLLVASVVCPGSAALALVVPPPPAFEVAGSVAPLGGIEVPSNGGIFHVGNGIRVELSDGEGAALGARELLPDPLYPTLKLTSAAGLPAGEYRYRVTNDEFPGSALGPFTYVLVDEEDTTPPQFEAGAAPSFDLVAGSTSWRLSFTPARGEDDFGVAAYVVAVVGAGGSGFNTVASAGPNPVAAALNVGGDTVDIQTTVIDLAGNETARVDTIALPPHPLLIPPPDEPEGCSSTSGASLMGLLALALFIRRPQRRRGRG